MQGVSQKTKFKSILALNFCIAWREKTKMIVNLRKSFFWYFATQNTPIFRLGRFLKKTKKKIKNRVFCFYKLTHKNNSVACYVIEVRSFSFKKPVSALFNYP